MVHNAGRRGQDNVAELTRGQQLDDPLLEVGKADVKAGRDNTALVKAIDTRLEYGLPGQGGVRATNIPSVQLDDDLARPMVVNFLELADVACKHTLSARCCERLNLELHEVE